jgi:DNA-binding transcriptional MocR family regulator
METNFAKSLPMTALPRVEGTVRVKYTQVIASLERLAASGTIDAGGRLPSHRELARQFGVTIATLTRAMTELTRRGVLVTRTGSGTYLAEASVPRATQDTEGIADLRICIPPTGPVQAILDRVLARLVGAPALFGYEEIGGGSATRRAGADWLRLRGLAPAPEDILMVEGAHQGMLAALRAATRPGDRVLCEQLHYTGLRHMAELLQIRLVGVPVSPAGLDIEAFARLCREVSPRAGVLTPVTQNPTTATMTAEARRAVVEAARAAELILVEDDINGHLAGAGEPTLAELAPERVILVTSLSKSVAPGLRSGYVLAPTALHEAVRSALYELGWTASALHAALATALITGGAAEACLHAQRSEALERMALARRRLGPAVVLGSGQPLYHAWVPLPAGWRAEEFTAELVARQVLVAPASSFRQDDSAAPEAIRLSLGGESRALLDSALRRVADVLARRRVSLRALV